MHSSSRLTQPSCVAVLRTTSHTDALALIDGAKLAIPNTRLRSSSRRTPPSAILAQRTTRHTDARELLGRAARVSANRKEGCTLVIALQHRDVYVCNERLVTLIH